MKYAKIKRYTKIKINDPLWVFLAEYSLDEFTSDDDIGGAIKGGLLFQTIQDFGIPPECLNKIETTLIEFVKQTMLHINQDKRDFPIVIHLYCQEKMIKSGSLTETASDLQAQQTMEPMQMIHPADIKTFGGWGFFLIERARDFHPGSSVSPHHLVDLYLYKEGE